MDLGRGATNQYVIFLKGHKGGFCFHVGEGDCYKVAGKEIYNGKDYFISSFGRRQRELTALEI